MLQTRAPMSVAGLLLLLKLSCPQRTEKGSGNSLAAQSSIIQSEGSNEMVPLRTTNAPYNGHYTLEADPAGQGEDYSRI